MIGLIGCHVDGGARRQGVERAVLLQIQRWRRMGC